MLAVVLLPTVLALVVPFIELSALRVPDPGLPNRTQVVLGGFLSNIFWIFVVQTLAAMAFSLAFGTSYTRVGEFLSAFFSGITHAVILMLLLEFSTAGLSVPVAFLTAAALVLGLYMVPWWILHRASANAAAAPEVLESTALSAT